MAVDVAEIVRRAKVLLLETGAEGVRWTNNELVGWLNESYEAITGLRPDASTVTATFDPVDDQTRQELPAGAVRLINVNRNLIGAKSAIRLVTRKEMDDEMPGWHGHASEDEVENYVFDEAEPVVFYLYPAPSATASVEIVYAEVPAPHALDYGTVSTDPIKMRDIHAPAIIDYIMYRAFSKDMDDVSAMRRATVHFQAFTSHLGIKGNVALTASPNRRDRGQSE